MRFLFAAALAVAALAQNSNLAAPKIDLPNKPDDVKFAVIGDNGTGERPEYEVGEQMIKAHQAFPFTFVVMLGDNLYGSKKPEDYKRKFEDPYKSLIDGGVKFYASLGNHDDSNERYYARYNMGGQRYFTIEKGPAEFFVLDSTYFDSAQRDWLVKSLEASHAAWKICFFHHPLYSSSHYHGPDLVLRGQLEPIFEKYGVNLVLSGHEHVYERLKPQHDIYYFVLGNSAQLRYQDLRPSDQTAKGFDTDRSFMLMEIAKDDIYFQTISRAGATVDSGDLKRQIH